MVNSRCPIGFHLPPLHLDVLPPRTPGSLGSRDAGDPDCSALMGDSPGPLGRNDPGEPAVRLPFSAPRLRLGDEFLLGQKHVPTTTAAEKKAIRAALLGFGKRHRRKKDDARGESRTNLDDREGKVATVYFATGRADIDAKGTEEINKVYNYYRPMISLRKVTLRFVGYADYRGSERYNDQLADRRARAVSRCFAPLQTSPNYTSSVESKGESEVPQIGSTSSELNPYRRVDIYAAPHRWKPPTKTEEPSKPAISYRWKVRLKWTGSAPKIGGSALMLEIVDLDNRLGMEYEYVGTGLSVGAGGAGESDWRLFETKVPIGIKDFYGTARHTSFAAQIIPLVTKDTIDVRGPSVDIIQLFGPKNVGADSVYVGWAGLFDRGIALGLGTDVGILRDKSAPYEIPSPYD